jgi:retinol dehydrogenase-12
MEPSSLTVTRYNLSKYLQVLVLRKLCTMIDPLPSLKSDSLKETNKIVINWLDPCFCGTGLSRDISGALRIAGKIFTGLFARKAEEGARLVVAAAAAGRGTHGGYLRAGGLREPVEMVTGLEGVERGEKLWAELGKRLERMSGGVMDAVKG